MLKKDLGVANNGVAPRIRLNDGYLGEPIWRQPENDSTYYSHEVDTQCSVPVRSKQELMAELDIRNKMPVSLGEEEVINIQFLINVIGIVIIDIGAFVYMSIYDESQIIALIMLMLGNGIGGVLYKYSKNK